MEKGQFSLIEEFQLISVEGNEKNIKLPSGEHCYNNHYKQELPKDAAMSRQKFENRISAKFQSPPGYPVITKRKTVTLQAEKFNRHDLNESQHHL